MQCRVTNPRWGFWGVLIAITILLAVDAMGSPLRLVSTIGPGEGPVGGSNGDSFSAAITPDARFVLFASTANNLAVNPAGNPIPLLVPASLNVYLRDRSHATNTLISANLTGLGGGNGDSIPTAVSTNGRYALFESSASDLLANDTNSATDIFLRDLLSGTTALVSVSTNGTVANRSSRSSVMTPDGRYVAFVSAASNLVPDDTNGIADVFVRDLQTGTTTLASVNARPTNSLSASELPVITPDGRYVAFYSTATNLVGGVRLSGEVYVRDLLAGTTTWAGTNARAAVQPILLTTNLVCYNHALSDDGKYLAFLCRSNPPAVSLSHGALLRYALETGITQVIHTNAQVLLTSRNEDLSNVDITPDGRFVVFIANTNDTTGTTTCIYRWDADSGINTLVSGNLSNRVPANSTCESPSIDPSGRFVVFVSSATNLVTNELSGDFHIYVRDMQAATTTLVDVDAEGAAGSANSTVIPRWNGDGTAVLFDALDSKRIPNDRNHDYDVFVRLLTNATTELISAHHPSFPSGSPNGISSVSSFAPGSNGRQIVFASDADNLVPNDTNGVRDIFIRDRVLLTNLLISVSTNGSPGDGPSSDPSLSGDNRWVAFTSAAANLVAGDTNKMQDVFVRDLQSGTTLLISVNSSGGGSGNSNSHSPSISMTGRQVLFRSRANNLAPGSFSGSENLFWRDLNSMTTYALTTGGVTAAAMTSDGRYVAFSSGGALYLWDAQSASRIFTNNASLADRIGLNADATRIAYLGSTILRGIDRVANANWTIANSVFGAPRAGLRFTGDGRFLAFAGGSPTAQVWLHDFELRTNILISTSFDRLTNASGNCDSVDISANGRFVAFRSFATNLVALTDTRDYPDIFLHDRSDGSTRLLSRNRFGTSPADRGSLKPILSADGRNVFFQSWASDLAEEDFNHESDVFGFGLLLVDITPGAAPSGPTLSWWTRPGEAYEVQFKNNLSDGNWLVVAGTINFGGERAQLTDLAPSAGPRFYRLRAF